MAISKASSSLQMIFRLLPTLSSAEISELRKRVTLLSSVASPQAKSWLLEGMTIELRRRGLWSGQMVPKHLLPSEWQRDAEAAERYLLEGLGAKNPTTTQKIALGALAASAIIDRLTRQKFPPVSPKTVLASISQVAIAMDDAYPGYWGSAALGICLKLK